MIGGAHYSGLTGAGSKVDLCLRSCKSLQHAALAGLTCLGELRAHSELHNVMCVEVAKIIWNVEVLYSQCSLWGAQKVKLSLNTSCSNCVELLTSFVERDVMGVLRSTWTLFATHRSTIKAFETHASLDACCETSLQQGTAGHGCT